MSDEKEHIQQVLESFRKLFPSTRLMQDDTELRYRFRRLKYAQDCEGIARQIILTNRLPLVADLEIWESRGFVHEISLVVKMAPQLEELPCY